MSSLIDLLLRLARDADLRHAGRARRYQLAAAAALPSELQWALAAGDGALLARRHDAGEPPCCALALPHPDTNNERAMVPQPSVATLGGPGAPTRPRDAE